MGKSTSERQVRKAARNNVLYSCMKGMTAIPRSSTANARQNRTNLISNTEETIALSVLGSFRLIDTSFTAETSSPKLMKMLKYEMIVCANTASP